MDTGKEKLFSRLEITEKGAGYCHFPKNPERNYHELYMKGLNSEQLVTSMVNGRPKSKWVKKSGVRNEPLDLRNYATAAVELLHPNWESLEKKINAGINYMKPQKTAVQRQRKTVERGLVY